MMRTEAFAQKQKIFYKMRRAMMQTEPFAQNQKIFNDNCAQIMQM